MVTKAKNQPSLPLAHDAHAALQAVPACEDVVEFTLRCVYALAPDLSAAVREATDRHVRDLFGGDEVWVGKRKDLTQRNAAIMRDYLKGERLGLLSRRYGLSERWVLKIVKG